MIFEGFPKIPRLSREVVVSEKIDGTNACIAIDDEGGFFVGSRTRWITPQDDNHGFARWAYEHQEELRTLGPGRHWGEWWGSGIQRKYGKTGGEKHFSLFNTHRWSKDEMPACCNVVPVLYQGVFEQSEINYVLLNLKMNGSVAAPGFMDPEGIIIYHEAAKQYFKKTYDGDAEFKKAVIIMNDQWFARVDGVGPTDAPGT